MWNDTTHLSLDPNDPSTSSVRRLHHSSLSWSSCSHSGHHFDPSEPGIFAHVVKPTLLMGAPKWGWVIGWACLGAELGVNSIQGLLIWSKSKYESLCRKDSYLQSFKVPRSLRCCKLNCSKFIWAALIRNHQGVVQTLRARPLALQSGSYGSDTRSLWAARTGSREQGQRVGGNGQWAMGRGQFGVSKGQWAEEQCRLLTARVTAGRARGDEGWLHPAGKWERSVGGRPNMRSSLDSLQRQLKSGNKS